jgi:hypothetical protein
MGSRKRPQNGGGDAAQDVAAHIERLRKERGIRTTGGTTADPNAGRGKPDATVAGASVARQLDRLRACRVRPAPKLGIGTSILRERDRAAKVSRKLGELIGLWEQLVDPDLLPHTVLTGMRGSVLHVTVPSSSVAFELDRALREGLTAALRAHFRGTLTRVKVRIERVDQPNGRSHD